jgi:hypothetical protein
MSENGKANAENDVVEAISQQLEHFRRTEPPCRGMELPDGIILRHAFSRSLYFYLRTKVEDGKIKTQVFASDSPYDRQKASIGSVITPMFEHQSDHSHLEKLEALVRRWVEFVQEDVVLGQDFQSFHVNP